MIGITRWKLHGIVTDIYIRITPSSFPLLTVILMAVMGAAYAFGYHIGKGQ